MVKRKEWRNVRSLIGNFCLDIMPEFDNLVKAYKEKEKK